MKVLHIAAELYPLAKTGGLADVVAALPAALVERGIDARLLLPGLPAILEGVTARETIASFGPAFGAARVALVRGRAPQGTIAYIVDAPWLYARAGGPYQGPDGREWPDNARRLGLLGWTAAQIAAGGLVPDWRPDIVHGHDWHAGLAFAHLHLHPAHSVRTVFTIHNLAYHGLFAIEEAASLGIPSALLTIGGMEYHGRGSFMKSGLIWSDRITTVSPRYAEEILTPEFGHGLDGILRDRRDRLAGLLNGVDTVEWDPVRDPHIARHYRDPAGKAENKAALQRELGLEVAPEMPLAVIVSRLTAQKGIDLVAAAIERVTNVQLALLGAGDRELEAAFRAIAARHPDRVAVRIGYDEALAHRMLAGGDLILVPSRFEPCGLTQLYGLRYGTLPLVRRAGGLADTVTDDVTGFVFDAATEAAFAAALRRAIETYRDRVRWHEMMARAMAEDFSWGVAAARYADLYAALIQQGTRDTRAGSRR